LLGNQQTGMWPVTNRNWDVGPLPEIDFAFTRTEANPLRLTRGNPEWSWDAGSTLRLAKLRELR
jgi:hypothetical protein